MAKCDWLTGYMAKGLQQVLDKLVDELAKGRAIEKSCLPAGRS
jgi:hypothetical protein